MASDIKISAPDNFPWHLGIFDAHCHPTDTMHNFPMISQMKARGLTVMSTRSQDQELVEKSASSYALNTLEDLENKARQCGVVPCFGWHPWFSHLIFDDTKSPLVHAETEVFKVEHYRSVISPVPHDEIFLAALPQPRPLSSFLHETRMRLAKYPAALVGEIGLDKAFRLPAESSVDGEGPTDRKTTPGRREGRRLTPYRVHIQHQKVIFQAQLSLAGELGRPVSVHGVQAHGILFKALEEAWKTGQKYNHGKKQTLRESSSVCASPATSHSNPSKPFPPRICLHSYSGSPEQAQQYLHPTIPADIYFSFSALINNFSSARVIKVIKLVPDNRILVESDYDSAGDKMDDLLQQVCRQICEIKGWELDTGVAKLGMNWRDFIFSSTC